MSERVTISYTRDQAQALGLLTCKCGHPPNNHFNFSAQEQPCAHCSCRAYHEVARGGGRILKVMRQPSPPEKPRAPRKGPYELSGRNRSIR